MTNPLKTLDTGTACTPTPRDDVTGPGMPASSPATDYGVACATGVHADTNSPLDVGATYPPTATPGKA